MTVPLMMHLKIGAAAAIENGNIETNTAMAKARKIYILNVGKSDSSERILRYRVTKARDRALRIKAAVVFPGCTPRARQFRLAGHLPSANNLIEQG